MAKIILPFEMPADIKYINGLSNALYYLFALLVLASLFQYFIKNKIHNLNAIVIKGNVIHNDTASIRDQLSSNINGNFYNIDLIKTKQTFESITWINQAVVKRVYPNQLEVKLSEFVPRAIWGNREDLKLVDDFGLVFEANVEVDEYDQMPIFIGPDGQGRVLLDMYKNLSIVLAPLKSKLKILELNARGSWIVTLAGGAHIELGRGNVEDVMLRAKRFSNGVEQMLLKFNKKLIDIEYVDLRHTEGYAMRMHGVRTFDSNAETVAIKK